MAQIRGDSRPEVRPDIEGSSAARAVDSGSDNKIGHLLFQAQNSDGMSFRRHCTHSMHVSLTHRPVFLGYVGWAAGNFFTGYVLSELPVDNGGVWTDTPLVATCMAPKAGAQKGSTGQ